MPIYQNFPTKKVIPKIDISTAVVTLTNTLTYNGQEQTQLCSVVLNGETLIENTDYFVTDNTEKDAGNYTLSVCGKGNYEGRVTKAWSIVQLQGSISVSPSTLTVAGAVGATNTATLTIVGDGAVSAVSSDTSIATVSISGDTVTVTLVATGETTVTITLADGAVYLGSSCTLTVSTFILDAVLANNSPAAIKAAAESGTASSLWSVGDRTSTIAVSAFGNMSATSVVCAFILGFDHNSAKEGTGISFQFGKTTTGTDIALVDSGCGSSKTSGMWFNMNNAYSNSGGWASSRMRTTIIPAFISALPSEWQNVLSETIKYTDNTGGGSDTASYVTATTDKMFLLSEYEAQGSRRFANSAEQNYQMQYDYYKNGNPKTKYKHNNTSTACIWVMRSPYANDSNCFCVWQNDGSFSVYNSADISSGFCPVFRIA